MNRLQDLLYRDWKNGNISHANLIIGKNTFHTCKEWARDIQGGKLDPLDNFLIEDDGSKFGIKELRELQNNMLLSPNSSFKIALIENIERLSIPAINSILKILEEPPNRCVFILTTSNLALILDTVISRCRLYESNDSMIEDEESFDFDIIERNYSDAEIIEFVEENCGDKQSAKIFLKWLGQSFRSKLIEDREVNLADGLMLIQKAYTDVDANVNARLCVELLLLRLTRLVSRIESKI